MAARTPFPAGVDLARFVKFNPSAFEQRYRVASGDKRAGREGVCIGTIVLKHSGGYEVLLRHDDGTIDSYNAMQLFPVTLEKITMVWVGEMDDPDAFAPLRRAIFPGIKAPEL